MKEPNLGQVQLTIMEALWEKGRATAREITDAVEKVRPVAHSTVQTLLRQLERKGAVVHEVEERTFYFRPAVEPEKVRAKATRDLLTRLYDGSASSLVSFLLKHEEIAPKELEQIRALIDEAKSQDGGQQ